MDYEKEIRMFLFAKILESFKNIDNLTYQLDELVHNGKIGGIKSYTGVR